MVRTQNLMTEELLSLPEEGSTVHTLAALTTITFPFIFAAVSFMTLHTFVPVFLLSLFSSP